MLVASLYRIVQSISYHAWTMFLFTKSDMKTTLIPIAALAAVSAPLASLKQLIPMVFWIWLQLLSFNLANQTLDPAEDRINKKSRPLPAGRISRRTAIILRWILPFVNLAWSARYSKEVFMSCLAGAVFTLLYNEAGLAAGHWVGRNVVIGFGQSSFEVGACLIAGRSIHSLDNIAIFSIICSGAIFATTIQAQDFKDTEGDRVIGRKTLPLVAPHTARPTLFLLVAAWSIGLSYLWGLGWKFSVALNLLGVAVGWRYLTRTTCKEDQRNFYFYSAWLSLTHALPAYSRFFATSPLSMVSV